MLMPMLSQVSLAAKRINVFLELPESDLYVSRIPNSDHKIILKPSNFRWANAKDKFIPPILDPNF